MTSLANSQPQLNEAVYPIRTVSELTGVNSITLRAWETRYGLVQPERKESGHRLYSQADIDLINRVVGLLDRGMRVGQVANKLDNEAAELEDLPSSGEDLWQRYLNNMVAAVIRFDETLLEETYGEALASYPFSVVSSNLLSPLLVELGRRWETRTGSIAEEHFFGFFLRNKLGARFHHRIRNTDGPRLLAACLPGERHEIGLLMFALAALNKGFQFIMLGADMPMHELTDAVEKAECDAIVLSGVMPPTARTLGEQLPDLVNQSPVPVFVGGRTSEIGFDAINRAGAFSLGNDIGPGLKRLGDILNTEPVEHHV